MFSDLRENYTKGALLEKEVPQNPLQLFERWFQEAMEAKIYEPNAMVLSTVLDGKPSSRVVLLKQLDERGFSFFTNYESKKGKSMAENPNVALNFWWTTLEKQVRIEGVVKKLPEAESDAYFASRPAGSRLGAWVSEQSRIIENREMLENRQADFDAKYPNGEIERPPHWGGYIVQPHLIEFWQGRPSRLHDRLQFTKNGEAWEMVRLSP
jgi:pyridoxamine 5'-phosphate oxidase